MVDPEVLKRYVRADHNPDAKCNRGFICEKFAQPDRPNPNVIIRDIESARHLTPKQQKLLETLKAAA